MAEVWGEAAGVTKILRLEGAWWVGEWMEGAARRPVRLRDSERARDVVRDVSSRSL